jgi:Subtilase family
VNANIGGMRASAQRRLAPARVLATAALALSAWIVATPPAGAALSPARYRVSPLCGAPQPDHADCLGLRLVARQPRAQPGARVQSAAASHGGSTQNAGTAVPAKEKVEFPEPWKGSLSPQELRSVYGLAAVPAPSVRQTIAIVDAYDDPTAEHDLQVFDERYGLPACTTANGCFTKVKLHSPASEPGWAQEIATDLDVARGTCPSCRLLLVEASSNSDPALEEGEREAERQGADEISNSWGGPEAEVTPSFESTGPFDHPGTVITAAAGDEGYLNWDAEEGDELGAVDFPASSPHVVAVGGTRLVVGPGGTWSGESVWNGDGASGGGCSSVFTAPVWQQDVADFAALGCESKRAVVDVAADGDPYTGVAIYDSTPVTEEGIEYRGWVTIGGTSVASPFIAATFALAGGAGSVNGKPVEYPAQTLYENLTSDPGALHDVTVGSNGACTNGFDEETGLAECSPAEEDASCSAPAICVAGPGYDGPSGVGTPDGIAAFEPSAGENSPNATQGVAPAATPTSTSAPQTTAGVDEGNSGGGGTRSATTTDVSSGQGGQAVLLAGPSLTRAAAIALRRGHPKASQLSFTFLAGTKIRVRVTLARQTLVHGAKRWVTLPDSLALTAPKGHDSARLKLRRALAEGVYRLTLTPVRGTARSLVFHAG